jgi:hypothetical protein
MPAGRSDALTWAKWITALYILVFETFRRSDKIIKCAIGRKILYVILKTFLISPTNPQSQEYICLTREVSWRVQHKQLNNTIADENIEQPPTPKK